MEHLPQPSVRNRRSQDWRHDGTRLLGNVHDGHERTPFIEYPARRGFAAEDLMIGAFEPEQRDRAAAVVQNWLFFGLLEDVCGISVPSDDFLVTDDDNGDRFLCTRALDGYLEQWQALAEDLVEGQKEQEVARLRGVFRECTRFFQLFAVKSKPSYPEDFPISLNPILVLIETLQLKKHTVLGVLESEEPLVTNVSSEAVAELWSRGWCAYTVANIILPSGSPSCFAYAQLFRDCPDFIVQDHANCSPHQCAFAYVDEKTYKTQHRDGFCDSEATSKCPTLYPDVQYIESALVAENIPLMALTDKLELATVDDSQQPYVAISHVWADGMGSTSEKGFPLCQARFLADCAASAYNYLSDDDRDSVAFWVDSICVPGQRDMRMRAIVLMAQSYARAAAVVVVDSAMLTVSVADSVEEQLFVLYSSSWVRRMWTLPEVLLSKQLLFRVSDGLIDFRYYFTDGVLAAQRRNPVAQKMLGWFGQLMITPFMRSIGSSRPTSLDDIALHLAKRTSSKPADEILAIACVFDLDVRDFLPLDEDERMANFLLMYNGCKVPADIIFLDGPKLKVENFSWAPASFMHRQMPTDMTGSHRQSWSIATPQGLCATAYHCLQMQEKWKDDAPPPSYRLATETGDILTIMPIPSPNVQNRVAPGYYDILLLSDPVERGEEVLAVACRLMAELDLAADGNTCLHLGFEGYVHIFNEDANEDWNRLSVANAVRVRKEPVLIV